MSRTFLPHVITDDSALGGSVIEKSLRFNKADNTYLARTPSAQGDRRVFTLSWWMKLGQAGVRTPTTTIFSAQRSTLNPDFQINLYEHALIIMGNKDGNSSSYMMSLVTEQLFRDPTAWYHCVVAFNTSDGTSSNRIKIYVNGSQVTNFAAGSTGLSHNTYPSSGDQTSWGTNEASQQIGRRYDGNKYFDGYLAEINYVDGSQLDASSFGYTEFQTGLWRPKRYTGGYGDVNNGFHLEFKDNSSTSALGKDTSGNENDFTTGNFSVSSGVGNDSVTDTPTNNWATMSLNVRSGSNPPTYTNGNLSVQGPDSGIGKCGATFGLSSGKWYAEAKITHSGSNLMLGIINAETNYNNNEYLGSGSDYAIAADCLNTRIRKEGSTVQSSLGGMQNGDILGFAIDMDNGTFQLYNNGSTKGSQVSFTVANYAPFTFAQTTGADTSKVEWNFGQQGFTYTPPTGFKAVNSKNLPPNVPSIVRPQRHFDVATWTGNNTAGRLIPLEFKPDFVWVKCRTAGHDHQVTDSVRGSSKALAANLNEEEIDWDVLYSGNNKGMGDYVNGGFILDDDGNNARYNNTGQTYVAWCWKGGGAAVSNTNGNITSSVSVNEKAGFSIVSYTGNGSNGQTIGHGLTQAPQWIMLKNRDAVQNWRVWHHKLAADGSKRLILDQINASEDAGFLNDTAPTSTVFTLGNADDAWNVNGNKFIAYCWYEVPGYSKFGSYTGNGSDDGTYVHLGFKPAWLLIKRTDSAENWVLKDSARNTFNSVFSNLNTNTENVEFGSFDDVNSFDFYSNGFKIKGSNSAVNANNGTFVYMAFAEQPEATSFDTFPNAR